MQQIDFLKAIYQYISITFMSAFYNHPFNYRVDIDAEEACDCGGMLFYKMAAGGGVKTTVVETISDIQPLIVAVK